MKTRLWRGLAAAFVVGSFLALGGLTRLPYRAHPDDDARLRLSWRIRGEQAGGCRTPTAEELERLPPHMRNPDACVGSVPPFHLEVVADDRPVVSDTVRPSGARGDRPVYVFRDVALSPGLHRIRVRFEQEAVPGTGERGDDGPEPVRLTLERTIRLSARQIVLVTLHPERLELVVRREPSDHS